MTDEEIISIASHAFGRLSTSVHDANTIRFARAIIKLERERWCNKLTQQAQHMKANAEALRQWPEQADESRARELAATYMQELVWCENDLP